MSRRFFFCALVCGLLWPQSGRGYSFFRTDNPVLNPTPRVMGTESGRVCLTVKNGGAAGTVSIFCGACADPSSGYYELTPGETFTWGANFKETFSAQTRACCYSASGNQQSYISEEGADMPAFTATATATPTRTPTPTP